MLIVYCFETIAGAGSGSVVEKYNTFSNNKEKHRWDIN